MKIKGIIIAVIILAALVIIFVGRPFISKKTAKNTAAHSKTEKGKEAASPAKKALSKGMGGLTVKIQESNNKPRYLRLRAFRSEGGNSSAFITAFGSERMQELPPGTYDIEIDTVPPVLYKNVNIAEGKETLKDIGVITGLLNIKALSSKNKESSLPIRVMYPKSNFMVSAMIANRPAEILPGTYDIIIETSPKQKKEGVRVESGKTTTVDLGVIAGSVLTKVFDTNGKEVRLGVRVKNPADNSVVASTVTNRGIEVAPGEYDIEIMSAPAQTKKGVKINAGEETVAEFSVQNPPAAQTAPAPAKKR